MARGGVLNFDLPNSSQPQNPVRPVDRKASTPAVAGHAKFRTEAEIERLERDNLLLILESANWRVKGPDGAAELLGVRPTTLLSRMEKWGLKKPEGRHSRSIIAGS